MTSNIEFIQGKESHSSNWGKYYVKGLESFQVKEDFPENSQTKHESYQGYVCLDIPDGTLFTIFEQSGNKRGTDTFIFSICVADQGEVSSDTSSYGSGKTVGNYKVVATSGDSKVKAPRLMQWWIDSSCKTLEFAQACAEHIQKRGVKNPPEISVLS